MKDNKKRTQWFRWIALVFGFALGVYSYWPHIGKVQKLDTHWDVLYYTLKLMTGGYPLDNTVVESMRWARFVCPTSTCVFLMSYFSAAMDRLFAVARSLNRQVTIGGKTVGRDSVAIYGDNDLVSATCEGTRFIHAGNRLLKLAKHHIILMDDDEKSLNFYQDHEADFSKDTAYIGLQQMASFFLKSMPNVFYFNIYEEVARTYWKEHNICKAVRDRGEYEVVLLGYCRDNLGFQLLRYALLNNVFRVDQKITYHVFCKPEEAVRGFEYLKTMTDDQVVWHTECWQTRLDILCNADRILLCRPVNPHILNQLLLTCTRQQIHYYDPDNSAYPMKNAYSELAAFGCTRQVLNEGTILKQELHRDAMERHFQYIKNHGTQEEQTQIQEAEKTGTLDALKVRYWNSLTGFLKNSNVAASDYYTIYPAEPEMTRAELEERSELEHIRWCRFHYLCGWQYGELADGKRKDSERRLHCCLVPWEALPEEEREKDRQQVKLEGEEAQAVG